MTPAQKQKKEKFVYNVYLNSSAWAAKRKLVLERDGRTCQKCRKQRLGGLHVHHLTYRNLGDEPLEDLVTLCEHCHMAEHKKPKKKRSKRADKRKQSRAKAAKMITVKVNPNTLREKGTEAALEEKWWLEL